MSFARRSLNAANEKAVSASIGWHIERVVVPLARELDPSSPQRRLPDPSDAVNPERERARLAIEEAFDLLKLGFAADNVLERESLIPDCRQRCLPSASVRRTPHLDNRSIGELGPDPAKVWGFPHFGAHRGALVSIT